MIRFVLALLIVMTTIAAKPLPIPVAPDFTDVQTVDQTSITILGNTEAGGAFWITCNVGATSEQTESEYPNWMGRYDVRQPWGSYSYNNWDCRVPIQQEQFDYAVVTYDGYSLICGDTLNATDPWSTCVAATPIIQ